MSAALLQVPLFAPPPPIEPLDVHAVSIPARTFTGDFWFTHRSGDRLWFALGDVSGKGLNAALVMAMIQEELEHRLTSCARTGCDPATTMLRLHAFLRPLLPSNRFATVVIGWLADDGTLRVVNGGHCPPLLVRADGSIEEIGSTGPAVGVLPASRWCAATRVLGPGERLVLYTDGVTEAESPHGREFGTEGIACVLAREGSGCARSTVAALLDAVTRHAGGPSADDLTVLVIGR
jgi:sigma-B regulation protein RsbU (phosphoserine phosphatase)